MNKNKKYIYCASVFTLSFFTFSLFFTILPKKQIADITKTTYTLIRSIQKPATIEQLQAILQSYPKPFSIAGARCSQGGQIAALNGTVIDMASLNRIIAFDPAQQEITVEAGATWLDVQKYIDPYDLSIKVMQSYNDFSIGGSLSVNIMGRDIHYGQLIETVKEITILLADSSLIKASKTKNRELFNAAIGGYGFMGIIVNATLSLTHNTKLERKIVTMHTDDYADFFTQYILPDKNAVLHNANLYPNKLQKITSVTWYKTDKPLTITDRLYEYKKTDLKDLFVDQLLRRLSPLKKIRPSLEQEILSKQEVVWRNYEMSNSIQTLEPFTRAISTSILQQYFVPVRNLKLFVDQLRNIVKKYDINLINVSIRYVPQNKESLLTYTPEDSFALVLYINIFNTKRSAKKAEKWTQEIIEKAITLSGTYYLPYQLWGTKEQLLRAYPRFNDFMQLKDKYDPEHVFSNNLFAKYV